MKLRGQEKKTTQEEMEKTIEEDLELHIIPTVSENNKEEVSDCNDQNSKAPDNRNNDSTLHKERFSVDMFNALYDDYIDFKKYINNKLNSFGNINDSNCKTKLNTSKENEEVELLKLQLKYYKEKNDILMLDHQSHLKIIEILSQNSVTGNSDNETKIINQKEWSISHEKKRTNKAKINKKARRSIENQNRFESLYIDNDTSSADDNSDSDHNENTSTEKSFNMPVKSKKSKPNVCFTEKYVNNFIPISIPGNSKYSDMTKQGRKVAVVGDSHVRRINRRKFNSKLKSGRAYFKNFDGVNTKKLAHHIIPTLVDDRPDIVVIHGGCNDIYEGVNPLKVAHDVISIGKQCRYHHVNKVLISSITVRKDLELSKIIDEVNYYLRDLCQSNNFSFVNNQEITTSYLSRDGLHLKDIGTDILTNNITNVLNSDYLNEY